MSFLLKHWQVIGWVVAVAAVFTFIQSRDARIRAEGRAQVYLHQADSLQAVAEAFRDSLATRDSIAEERIQSAEEDLLQAETIIASIQENEPRTEQETDSTLSMLLEMVDDSVASLVDSLEVNIREERVAHEMERSSFMLALDAKDDIIEQLTIQVSARDQRIASLEQALAARVAAGIAAQESNTGLLEKALYAVGGFAVGYLAHNSGAF